jgi:hypothetical protein
MKKVTLLFLLTTASLWSCRKDDELPAAKKQPITLKELSGYVQKGPFVIGTGITVAELDERLVQTGKVFSAEIKDDQGAFALPNVTLNSQYVELRANGFYFNEVTGKLSTAQLALSALADVSNAASVNVNLLTHLEKGRVAYLMNTEKKTFVEAKKQAQREVLTLFNVEKTDMVNSEQLNIARNGEDNAILLAISAIVQGTRTESELSELVAKISLDVEADGKLDNAGLQSALVNDATLLNRAAVRENLLKRYSQLGVNVAVGDFEKHVQNFVSKTAFAFTKKIEYPASGKYGANLFTETAQRMVIPKASDYNWLNHPVKAKSFSLAALAPTGTRLRIRLAVANTANSSAVLRTTENWKLIADGKELEMTQTGVTTDGDFQVRLYGQDSLSLRMELYENEAVQPTTVKNFVFVGEADFNPDEKIAYEKMTDGFYASYNLLAEGVTTASPDYRSALFADVPPGQRVRVKITSGVKLEVNTEDTYWSSSAPNTWKKLSYAYANGQEVQELETISGVKAICSVTPVAGAVLPYTMKIEIFENGATSPTRVQQISWQ